MKSRALDLRDVSAKPKFISSILLNHKTPPILFISSLISLALRFDWNSELGDATVAFTMSLVMYTLVFWSLNEILTLFDFEIIAKNLWLLVLSLVCTFPYQLLSLDNFFYYKSNPYQFKGEASFHAQFVDGLRNNTPDISFPGKSFLFFCLVLVFSLLVLLARRRGKETTSLGLMISSPIILLQAWFNSSAGSPYSWLPTYEQPIQNGYSYVVYKFPNGQAAVNADDFVHTSMISLFQSGNYENLMLFRRPLPYYIVSQFSFFLNSFYVWIVINVLAWIVGSIIFLYVCKSLNLSRSICTVSLIGFSSAPLLLTFVAQPSTYLFTFLAVAFYLFVVSKALSKQSEYDRIERVIFLSTILFLLTYVAEPWIFAIFLTIYFSKRISAGKLSSILFGAVFLSNAYRVLLPPALDLEISKGNEEIPMRALKEVYLILISGNWGEILTRLYVGISGFASSFSMMLLAPIVLVITFGLLLAANSERLKKFKATESEFNLYLRSIPNLFLIGFLLQIFWSLGGNAWFGQFTHHIALLMFPAFILFATSMHEINRLKQKLGSALGLVAVFLTIYISEPSLSGLRQPMYQNFYGHSSSNL